MIDGSDTKGWSPQDIAEKIQELLIDLGRELYLIAGDIEINVDMCVECRRKIFPNTHRLRRISDMLGYSTIKEGAKK